MKISNNLKENLKEDYSISNLKLPEKIIDFFKSGGNLKIKCKKGSGIHIKKKNRGKFTASAKKAGLSVLEHARSVLNNPNATPLQKKRALFAVNSKKWKHLLGGILKALDGTKTKKILRYKAENPEIPKVQFLEPIKFVYDYYNSPGFNERFRRLGPVISDYENSKYNNSPYMKELALVKTPLKLKKVSYNEKLRRNANYNPKDQTIIIGSYNNNFNGSAPDYAGVIAHELGHALQSSIELLGRHGYKYVDDPYEKTYDPYANIYPVFRNSISYRRILHSLDDDKSKEFFERHPSSVYNSGTNIGHDALPDESYADLMALRYAMQKAGIFDSMKAGQNFTQQHLDQFRKKIKGSYRIFDNFSDEDIIWMMNNVAENNTNKLDDSNKNLYAKQGGSMRIPGVIDSNPNLDNMKGDYVTPKKKKKKKLLKKHLDGGILKTENEIPKDRRVINTININNGKLTLEEDGEGKRYWFRNGKLITEFQLKKYKYYDQKLGGYRLLSTYGRNNPYTPNLDKLETTGHSINDKKFLKFPPLENFEPSEESITLNIPNSAMHLATIPINVLDSVAINAGRGNSNIKTALGLLGKENTFGGASIPLGRSPESVSYNYNLHNLTNNHAYLSNPYLDYVEALYKKYSPSTKSSNDEYDKTFLEMEKDAEYAINHPSVINIGASKQFHDNVMADAFMRYEDDPYSYNSGLKNYVPMVTDIGNKVFNEKLILNWWNTLGRDFYNKGLKEYNSK